MTQHYPFIAVVVVAVVVVVVVVVIAVIIVELLVTGEGWHRHHGDTTMQSLPSLQRYSNRQRPTEVEIGDRPLVCQLQERHL